MSALRTLKWSRRREPAGRALRGVRRLLGWTALVAATLMLLTFVTTETSQAFSGNPTALVTQSATQAIAKQPTAASSVVKFAIKSTGCCANGSGHCHGLACAGACCPACSTGLIAAGWTVAQSLILQVDSPPAQASPTSTELDPQFRPPRDVL